MTYSINLEGSDASQFVQAIRKFGRGKYDKFEVATVVNPLPNLRIKVDDSALILERDDLVIAEHLTEHERTVTIGGGAETTMSVKSALKTGDRVIMASMDNGQLYIVIDKAIGR